MFIDLPSYINPRTKLVDEVIERVQEFHIIRVCGTPASGKTILSQLVANKLLEMYGHTTPIYTVMGWEKRVVEPIGWDEYLMQRTGVRGDDWPTYPAYLLLDEAQQSHWDIGIWTDLFKHIQPIVGSPFVILFSSYGSPSTGFAGFEEKYEPTPMVFAPRQQISMRPHESVSSDMPTSTQVGRRPVGLLLEEHEAMHILTKYPPVVNVPFPPLSADLKKYIFLIGDGHVGFVTSLVRAFKEVPVSVPMRNLN